MGFHRQVTLYTGLFFNFFALLLFFVSSFRGFFPGMSLEPFCYFAFFCCCVFRFLSYFLSLFAIFPSLFCFVSFLLYVYYFLFFFLGRVVVSSLFVCLWWKARVARGRGRAKRPEVGMSRFVCLFIVCTCVRVPAAVDHRVSGDIPYHTGDKITPPLLFRITRVIK